MHNWILLCNILLISACCYAFRVYNIPCKIYNDATCKAAVNESFVKGFFYNYTQQLINITFDKLSFQSQINFNFKADPSSEFGIQFIQNDYPYRKQYVFAEDSNVSFNILHLPVTYITIIVELKTYSHLVLKDVSISELHYECDFSKVFFFDSLDQSCLIEFSGFNEMNGYADSTKEPCYNNCQFFKKECLVSNGSTLACSRQDSYISLLYNISKIGNITFLKKYPEHYDVIKYINVGPDDCSTTVEVYDNQKQISKYSLNSKVWTDLHLYYYSNEKITLIFNRTDHINCSFYITSIHAEHVSKVIVPFVKANSRFLPLISIPILIFSVITIMYFIHRKRRLTQRYFRITKIEEESFSSA